MISPANAFKANAFIPANAEALPKKIHLSARNRIAIYVL
jgi:hypothetical protein